MGRVGICQVSPNLYFDASKQSEYHDLYRFKFCFDYLRHELSTFHVMINFYSLIKKGVSIIHVIGVSKWKDAPLRKNLVSTISKFKYFMRSLQWSWLRSILQVCKLKSFGLEDVAFQFHCALNMICQGATDINGSSAARSYR